MRSLTKAGRLTALCASLAGVVLSMTAHAQCPGVRPRFDWHNDGGTIIFQDLTDANVDSSNWDFGDGYTATGSIVEHVYQEAGFESVTLTVAAQGCEFSVVAMVVHADGSAVCSSPIHSSFYYYQANNNALEFVDASQGNGSDLAYFWAFGDGSLTLTTDTSHFYMWPGAYDVTHSIATLDSAMQTACVAGYAEHLFVNGNTSTCDSSLFLNLIVGSQLAPADLSADAVVFNEDLHIESWLWDFGDGFMDSNEYNSSHYYAFPGDFQVCVEVQAFDSLTMDTCMARSCTTLVSPMVGVAAHERAADLTARPVPFADELLLEGSAIARGARWRSIDVLGHLVDEGVAAGDGLLRLNTAHMPPGIYTILVQHGSAVNALRVVKR